MKYIVIASFFLFSCSPQMRHLRKYERLKARAEKHLALALAHGAKVNTDTLYAGLKVPVPGINISFPFQPVPTKNDTVYYDRDGVEVQVIYQKDTNGSMKARPIVKTDTVFKTVKVPYKVETVVQCECPNKWLWLLYGIIASGLVLVGFSFARRIRG